MRRKMENQQLVSLSLQCSSTPVGFGQGFLLGKNYVTTLEHPPYPTDVAPAGFYPFPRLKSTLKGRRFCDATDINKNATEVMGFHEMASSLASNTFTVAEKKTTLKEI
jgi:hypothetical protein